MFLGDSGNNELSLDIFHDHFSNTHLDHALNGRCPFHSNTDAHSGKATERSYLASSFLPASRLSKFRIVLNTKK